jgi:serine protease
LDELGLGPVFTRTLGRPNVAVADVPDGTGYSELVARLSDAGVAAVVEPNVMGWVTATPNDTHYATQQWSMNNTGQTSGVDVRVGVSGDGAEAWDVATAGSFGVVVGVVDTGVNYTHPDLYKNIWINQKEIPAARLANLTDIDSDGLITFRDLNNATNQGTGKITDQNSNGYIDGADILATYNTNGTGGWADGADSTTDTNSLVDDLVGWDFGNGDKVPLDINTGSNWNPVGHGSHVAGVIAAEWNNGAGIAGVSRNAQIMVLKWFQDNGSADVADVIDAINYATDMRDDHAVNVRVTNNSYQVDPDSPDLTTLETAITASGDEGILFVTTAGNGLEEGDVSSDDLAIFPQYPPAFDLSNMVTVAGTDRIDAPRGPITARASWTLEHRARRFIAPRAPAATGSSAARRRRPRTSQAPRQWFGACTPPPQSRRSRTRF